MKHYEGLTPDQRWKNELLQEIKEMNKNLKAIIEQNQGAQVKRTRRGRDDGATSG